MNSKSAQITSESESSNSSMLMNRSRALFRNKLYARLALVVFVACFGLTGVALMLRSLAATSVTVAVDTSTVVGTSAMQTGVTHTQYDIYPHVNESTDPNVSYTSPQAISALNILKTSTNWQNQHIYGWGAGNPQPSPPTATTDNINWKDMDGRVNMMRRSSNHMIITFCCSPDWMKGSAPGTTDFSKLEVAPLPEHVQDFANLTAKIAQRYPDVKYFQVWNEMKGMYGLNTPGCSPTACGQNRWDYERYTTLYNAVWDAVKAVRPDAQIGGPYVVMDHWGTTTYGSASNYPAKDRPGLAYYGDIDQRDFDVIKYWLKNKHGADYLTLDGKLSNRDGTKLVDDFAAAQVWEDIAAWVRNLDPAQYPDAKTLPLWWAEWYAIGRDKPADLNQNNAIMANSMVSTLKSGAALPLIWDANGKAQGEAFPLSLYTGVQDPSIGGAGTSGGKPTAYTPTSKGFHDFFQPGTQLTKVTVSDTNQVTALASKAKIMLVNKTAGDVIATVNGTNVTLSPYQVTFTDIPTTSTGTVTPPPPPPPPAVTLKLINADTDQVISTMSNGMTINLATARNLNIDATAPGAVESVRFDEAGQPSITESFPPYAIGGDAGTNSTDYFPWTPTVGSHTMTVKAFSADAAGGTELASTTMNFTVTDTTPTTTSTGWDLVYEDKFDTLNTSSTSPNSWSLYDSVGNGGYGLRRPGAFTIVSDSSQSSPSDPSNANNKLLAITASMNSSGQIVSGGMSNRTNLAYGKYEVRARTESDSTATMSGLALTWPASGTWPDDGELDWYETGTSVARNPIRSFFHWPCSEGACTYVTDANGQPVLDANGKPILKDLQSYATHYIDATQWHTYVMEWTPTSIKMFRDGQLIKMQDGTDAVTDVRKIPDKPHHVALQLDATANRTLTQPIHEYVDYVKVSKMSGTSSASDTTPPTVAWETPAAGDTVSGVFTEAANNCRVSATDASGVAKVDFFLDGAPVNTESIAPYNCFTIDTSKYPDGPHTLGAKAYDTAGNATGLITRSVNFVNTTADIQAPTVTITSPANNTQVSGIFTTVATAIDPPATTNGGGITKVEYYLDNTTASGTPNVTDTSAPYEYSVDTLNPVLTNGLHRVTAKAYDGAGNSSLISVEVNVQNADTTAPNAPTGLEATAASSTQINLSWAAAADTGANPSGVTKYNVLRKGPGDTSYLVIAQVNAPATTYQNDGLTASSNYSYTVQAVDAVNNTSANSNVASATTTAIPDTTPPTMPTNLTASAAGSNQVNVEWVASTDDGGSGLRGYNIYRNGSSTPLNGSTPITATSYGDGTVAPSTAYTYVVEAIDGKGNKSEPAGPVSVSMPIAPLTITLLPTSDAWVSKKFPDRSYGTTSQLKVDSAPDQDSILRFSVTGVGTKHVTSAKLRLYVAGASVKGGNAYKLLSTNWNESSVTWNTAPASDTVPIASLGAVSGGSIVDIDISSLITGDGTYGVKISSASSDTVVYNSKEASANKPQLVLTVE